MSSRRLTAAAKKSTTKIANTIFTAPNIAFTKAMNKWNKGGRHPFGVALFIAHFNVFFYFPHFNGVAPIIAHSQRERGRNYTVNAAVSLRSSTNTPNRWMLLHMDERFPTRRHIADCPLLQSFDIIVLALHRKFTCVAAYFFVRQDSRTSVADYASLRLCRPTASIRLCTHHASASFGAT